MVSRNWVAHGVLMGFALAGCGGGEEPEGRAADARGRALFMAFGCTLCHGPDGAGTTLGPPLRGLAKHWTREELASYLADPQAAVARDPRLAELARQYAKEMPAITTPEEQRLEIADYVLGF